MRNTRSAPSARHAEVKNKFTHKVFESEYYPINFVASDNYVFFNTLFQKPMHSIGRNLASKVTTWLYGPMRNPTRDFRGNTNAKMKEAVEFLESAAEIEYIREENFLRRYAEKNEMIKKIIEKSKESGANKFFNLINALNIALKGQAAYKKELDKEIKRIENNKEIVTKDAETMKKGRYVSVTKEEEANGKQRLTSEEYAARNELKGVDSILDDTKNPYFNFDGKKIFDSMFKEQSDFSKIVEKIIIHYGSQTLDTKHGILSLNKRQALALTQMLVREAYNILVTEYAREVKKKRNEDRSARMERVEKRLDKLMKPGGELDTFFNDIVNSPNPQIVLTTLADQNGIPVNADDMKELNHSTKVLRERLKKIWEQEKAQGKTKSTFYNWRRSKNLSKKDLEEYVYMMNEVKIQLYYTNEGMAAADFVKQGMAARIMGGQNTPTDIQAGMLVVDVSYENINDPKIIEKAQQLIGKAEQDISNLNAKQQKISTKDDFVYNTKELAQLFDQQRSIVEKLKADLDALNVSGTNMIKYINIHDTVKGYASIDTKKTQMFHGAAFGSTITSQVEIINQLLADAQLTTLDAEWLIFALINCGDGMIGSANKHSLEDYLSGYVGLLMFTDASFISQDVKNYMMNQQVSSVENIHLYTLNDTYVPSSFILHETAKAMNAFIQGVEEASYGTTLDLTTYNTKNAYATLPNAPWTRESLRDGSAWDNERREALKKTHLTMYFLAKFSELLTQLREQLSQK